MVSMFGAVTNTGLSEFLKLVKRVHEPPGSTKGTNARIPFVPFFSAFCAFFVALFAWCLNVDVDLLRTSASEYPVSKHEQTHEYYQYKNHHNGDYTDTAAATAFFGHKVPPVVWDGNNWGRVGKA